jgi:hypothetical protein
MFSSRYVAQPELLSGHLRQPNSSWTVLLAPSTSNLQTYCIIDAGTFDGSFDGRTFGGGTMDGGITCDGSTSFFNFLSRLGLFCIQIFLAIFADRYDNLRNNWWLQFM